MDSNSCPSMTSKLVIGEVARSLDDRFRLSLPTELLEQLGAENGKCVLAKQQKGCLSLWTASAWSSRLSEELGLIEQKLSARRLDTRLEELQRFGRLLSTRHREVQLGGRGRLVLPEGFREFLGAEAGGHVMIVGAAVCIEIWELSCWQGILSEQMPEFDRLLESLAG